MYSESEIRIERLNSFLESCELCPRKCMVNRMGLARGCCDSGSQLEISSYGPHFGEESELVGSHGSGTIFLTNCSLLCVYCQNYDISHLGFGKEYSIREAAKIMLNLERSGCHNINLVTPTHYAPQLVQAISIARKLGLNAPIVWNCGGYENVEVVKLLEGFVDIYMPDIKYSDRIPAERFSEAPDYFKRSSEAILEMQRQVGDLIVDENNIATRGLLIRHLVLPNNLAGSEKILKFIADEVSLNCYINIMAQYMPCGRASEYQELNRKITSEEYRRVTEYGHMLGLHRGFD